MVQNQPRKHSSLTWAPVPKVAIRRLFVLASSPFTLAAFEDRWRAFGWTCQRRIIDLFSVRLQINRRLVLWFHFDGAEVKCGALPFCYWENYKSRHHTVAASYRKERSVFNALYDDALGKTRDVAGRPFRVGRDTDDLRFRYSVWRTEYGLLILQQCAFDIQFGVEINFWLEPLGKERFAPGRTLIDWLARRHPPPA